MQFDYLIDENCSSVQSRLFASGKMRMFVPDRFVAIVFLVTLPITRALPVSVISPVIAIPAGSLASLLTKSKSKH
jgi:hypothetical protein